MGSCLIHSLTMLMANIDQAAANCANGASPNYGKKESNGVTTNY